MTEYTKELAYMRLAAFKALDGWGTRNMSDDPEERKWKPVNPWTFEERQKKADQLVEWMLSSPPGN